MIHFFKMCHAEFEWKEPEERQEPPPTPVAQYVEYNQWQWQLYNELLPEVFLGIYGEYYHSSYMSWRVAPTGPTSRPSWASPRWSMTQRPVSVDQGNH